MEFITHNILPIVILLVNLLASISYYIIYSKETLKIEFFKLPMVIQKIYVALFVMPLFITPFISQNQFMESNIVYIIIGIIIALIGLLIIIFSFIKIGIIPSIKNKGGLSTTGVYGIVRHPIYLGTITTQVGFIVLNQASISLIYLPVSVILYYIMATIEEKDLVANYGNQYIEFRKRTKRKIIPLVL